MRNKLIELLEETAEKMDCPQMNEVADYLIANGVTILPEGAIILTRAEIDALNEHQKKLNAGVPEVVRCEDCKYCDGCTLMRHSDKFTMSVYMCHRDGRKIEPNHFCSYGERREENDKTK